MTQGNDGVSITAAATTDAIIDRFGGVGRLSELLGLTPWSVYKWRERGISPSQYQRLLALARREGVELTIDELFQARGRSSAA